MTEIEIPFLEQFHDDIANGQKIATTRSKKYGEVGDTFTVKGQKCVLLAIFKMRLWHVAYHLHDAEGFQNTQAFIDCWNKIHPKVQFKDGAQRNYWVHIFTPCFEWDY